MKHGKYSSLRLKAATGKGGTVTRSLPFRAEHCKFFMCAQHLLFNLNNKESCLLHYLCERMDDGNNVYLDRNFKEEFIAYTKHIGIPENNFSMAIIDKAITKLKKLNLIIQKQQGYYMVNPRYFFKGSEVDRIKVLEKEIKKRFNENLPLDGLLPMPEESLRNSDIDIVCLN